MLDTVKQLLQEVEDFSPKTENEVEEFRLTFLGKKGLMNELFVAFKDVPGEKKKEFGQAINTLKQTLKQKLMLIKELLKQNRKGKKLTLQDLLV